jgi:hypothetical protein
MNKRFSILLIVLIITAGLITYWISAATRSSNENEHFFSGSLFATYHQQLQTTANNFADFKKIEKLNKTIYDDTGSTAQQQREIHEQFVGELRRQIALHKNDSYSMPEAIYIQELVRALYLNNSLRQQSTAFLFTLTDAPKPHEPLANYLLRSHHTLHTAMKATRIKQSHSHWEDQFLAGNVPQHIISNGVELVRTAQPLIDSSPLPWWIQKPTLSPEFRLFLQSQPSHLYVNLMKRHGKEGTLTSAIENIGIEIPHVSVVTLDRNSSFYWQDFKKFPEQLDSQTFKQQFVSHLQSSKNGYFWSRNLDPAAWNNQLVMIVNEIHDRYFADHDVLNRSERQDFIELTHLAILDALVKNLKPASMNITCRQAMDRAPALLTLWLLQQKSISTNEEIAGLLLAPPVIIHNRASHLSRIKRFISAAEHFR